MLVSTYASWPTERMEKHIQLIMDMHEAGRGIWLEENCFYGAAFHLGCQIKKFETYDFFTYEGRNFYNGGENGPDSE